MHDPKAQDLVLSNSAVKLEFLNKESLVVNMKLEELRKELICMNDDKVSSHISFCEKFNEETRPKTKTNLQALINKAKKTKDEQKVFKRKIEDPREGITRRFANYMPTKRSQYTEDSLNIFYPNVSDKFHDKLEGEWEVDRGRIKFQNLLNDDMILSSYINKFGNDAETIKIYKKFRSLECDNELVAQRFLDFREKLSKRRGNFHTPGCSAKVEEGMNEFSIIKTHKEFFCRRCEVYDCRIHGILDISSFVHPGFPTSREMIESFGLMVELCMSIEQRQQSGKWICGDNCFMALGTSQEEEEIELNEFTIAKIKLGLQVFKFDPCNVRLYCNKDEVTCHQIYRYFTQEYNERKTFPEYYANTVETTPIRKSNKRGKAKKPKKHHFANLKILEENFYGIDPHPCYHSHYDKTCTEEEQSCMDENCGCFQRGFCDKYCLCDLSKCKIRRKGCNCKSDCIGKKCPCHSINAECDPDLCKCCFNTSEGKQKTSDCQNQSIYFGKGKRCKVGPSDVCPGLGLFNIEPIKKGDFVCTYLGELISWQEADMRERWNVYDQETYLTNVSDEFVIDAKYIGNKARFINHGKSHSNLVARYSFSKGVYHFAFFAKQDIPPGSELLFDYEGGGSALKEQFDWIRHPNPPKIRKEKVLNIKDDNLLVPLTTGAKPAIGFKMQFKLNSQPRKFLKIEDSHVREKDLNDEGISGYYAYQEVSLDDEEEEDISTPLTITTTTQTTELIQGFNHNIPTGTFQPKGKQEEIPFMISPFKISSVEYGSGIFPIPILDLDPLLNTKIEPRSIDMNYEENLFRSLMNPVLPTEAQKSTSKKINLKPIHKQNPKPKAVVLGGDQEEDAIIIE